MSILDDYKMGSALFGMSPRDIVYRPSATGVIASTPSTTQKATAMGVSSDGYVAIVLDNSEETIIVRSSVAVKPGDRVLVTITGVQITVTAVIDGGDRMQGEIDGASDAANNAAADAATALSNASFAQTQAADAAADALAASQAASTAQTQATNAEASAARVATDLAITAEELADEVDKRAAWITWDDDSLRIGREDSPFTTEYTNTSLTFLQNGIELARFAGNKMHNPVIEVGSKLSIGNSAVGTFDWIYEDSGDLVFKYAGGA